MLGADSIPCDPLVLGTDDITSMVDACCACGGGVPKDHTTARSEAQVAVLQAGVDSAAAMIARTCVERTPDGMEAVLGASCVRLSDSNGGSLAYVWAANGTFVLPNAVGMVELAAQGGASLRACSIVCSKHTTPRCTGVTFSTLGCLVWFNGVCSTPEADTGGGAEDAASTSAGADSAPTFRRCADAGCSSADTAATNKGLTLALALPCSSDSPPTSLTTFDEREAPCREQYSAVYEKQLQRYEKVTEDAERAEASAHEEQARVDGAVAEAETVGTVSLVVLAFLMPATATICVLAAQTIQGQRGAAAVTPASTVGGGGLPPTPTPPTWRLLGPSGAVLLALFGGQSALMMLAGKHKASTGVHKTVYATLHVFTLVAPMIIIYRTPNVARQAARKRRNEHVEGTGAWSRFKARTKPISFGGKYFVRLLLGVEAIEVCTRATSIALGAAVQSNRLTTFVTLALGTNLVVTPTLLRKDKILHLLLFDVVSAVRGGRILQLL